LVSLLFPVLLLTLPRVQPFVKVGGTRVFRAIWSRRRCVEPQLIVGSGSDKFLLAYVQFSH